MSASPTMCQSAPSSSSRPRGQVGLMTLARIEISKMRRLHTPAVVLAFVVVIVVFEGASLYSSSSQAIASDPGQWPWAHELMGVAMLNALLHPILVAVIASRQVDMENTGAGWTLNATAGTGPGRLMRVKLAVITMILLGAATLQITAIVVLGVYSGITVPFDSGPWLGYLLMLWGSDCALAVGHVLLSARFENQMISMGAGLLGAFAGMYLFLAPQAFARWVPWGCFALINPTRIEDGEPVRILYTEPATTWFCGFVVLALIGFVVLTRRGDRIER